VQLHRGQGRLDALSQAQFGRGWGEPTGTSEHASARDLRVLDLRLAAAVRPDEDALHRRHFVVRPRDGSDGRRQSETGRVMKQCRAESQRWRRVDLNPTRPAEIGFAGRAGDLARLGPSSTRRTDGRLILSGLRRRNMSWSPLYRGGRFGIEAEPGACPAHGLWHVAATADHLVDEVEGVAELAGRGVRPFANLVAAPVDVERRAGFIRETADGPVPALAFGGRQQLRHELVDALRKSIGEVCGGGHWGKSPSSGCSASRRGS
jgi:hypothetical protein